MFTIKLYKFNKKTNSTKLPPVSSAYSYGCVLLDDTSILYPRIALRAQDGVSVNNPTACNYAYIEEFKRYYYINNWEWASGRWVASMVCDVLATYKTEIGNSSQYILRNATTYNDSIPDLMYPCRSGCTVEQKEMLNPFSPVLQDGSYVVGIINSDSAQTGVGAVSYYIMSPAQFSTFRSKLLGDSEWFSGGISELSEDLSRAIFNPFQYVASCTWFPVVLSGTALTSLPYGWYSLPVACSRMSAHGTATYSGSVAIPRHPQSAGRSFLNDSPYSQYRFDWPCVGCIPIDPKYLYAVDNFGYICQIDLVTGKAIVELKAVSSDLVVDRTITVLNAQIGVPIKLAQISADYAGQAVNIAGGSLGDIVNVGISAVNGLFNGKSIASIGTAVASSFAQVQSSGANGCASSFFLPPTLQAKFLRVVDEMPSVMGKPLCAAKTISAISGYTICQNAAISISGTSEENAQIVDFMNGGFYYE